MGQDRATSKDSVGHRQAYANKEKLNQSELGAAVGKAHIRQRVYGTVVRWVTAATMAGYQDLSEFERGVTVGAREMGHAISEVAMKFGFSRAIISRVYREYRESGKTSKLRHRCDREKIIQKRDQRRPTRIVMPDRRATHPQIAADFNFGPSTSVTVRTIQRNIIDMGFRGRMPTRVSLLTARHKALRLT
ncbi:HTH_Tnp_Tc3_2 domain-containing protein [Trichonephila clavipes]|nr:HTH_Tnp_Tc3_2 domain-containing protein [Trichonephila clavipes]